MKPAHTHPRAAHFRSRRTRRWLTSGFATALAAGALLTGTSAQAAMGLGAGLVDGNASQKPDHLGEKCSVASGATAKKVIAVTGTGGSTATVDACEKWDDNYYSAMSVDGYVGYNGIADAGAKHEGDGKTPSGVYNMGYGFGMKAEPKQFHGSKYVKTTKDDVWVDGDAVKGYNTMQKKSDGYSGESMHQTPAYDYGQVIDYNTAATPGKGSAIFLHVNTGSQETAGCVSVSEADLLRIFEWEDDSAVEMAINR
ncbi:MULTISPECIES: L,D-transpeptidase family protein [unclassified Brevibacterium]|uniref:L,D-transpeptidase family protein n=1 Tax=unclassified Brevibacterium TaxID=2614124 RepID=UPI000C3C425B|nr:MULTISPECIES: L,D-transpeptidase family protein [unclassified Brevibacterium]SMY04093.1 L,D-peptidoglycan transpeptidase YkuD, ErfK/YbiS/YcfS/YnhG family [Brevibacterium sp. 239c]